MGGPRNPWSVNASDPKDMVEELMAMADTTILLENEWTHLNREWGKAPTKKAKAAICKKLQENAHRRAGYASRTAWYTAKVIELGADPEELRVEIEQAFWDNIDADQPWNQDGTPRTKEEQK